MLFAANDKSTMPKRPVSCLDESMPAASTAACGIAERGRIRCDVNLTSSSPPRTKKNCPRLIRTSQQKSLYGSCLTSVLLVSQLAFEPSTRTLRVFLFCDRLYVSFWAAMSSAAVKQYTFCPSFIFSIPGASFSSHREFGEDLSRRSTTGLPRLEISEKFLCVCPCTLRHDCDSCDVWASTIDWCCGALGLLCGLIRSCLWNCRRFPQVCGPDDGLVKEECALAGFYWGVTGVDFCSSNAESMACCYNLD